MKEILPYIHTEEILVINLYIFDEAHIHKNTM